MNESQDMQKAVEEDELKHMERAHSGGTGEGG